MRTLSDMADNMPILPSPFFVILPDSYCTALHCYATIGMLGCTPALPYDCWDAGMHAGPLPCNSSRCSWRWTLSDKAALHCTSLPCHCWDVGMHPDRVVGPDLWSGQYMPSSPLNIPCPSDNSPRCLALQTTPQDALPIRPPLKMLFTGPFLLAHHPFPP